MFWFILQQPVEIIAGGGGIGVFLIKIKIEFYFSLNICWDFQFGPHPTPPIVFVLDSILQVYAYRIVCEIVWLCFTSHHTQNNISVYMKINEDLAKIDPFPPISTVRHLTLRFTETDQHFGNTRGYKLGDINSL